MAQKHELHTDTFLPYMRDVARCERSLHELNLMWRLIESSAKMNCAEEARSMLPMMAATRNGFEQLEKELVQSMVEESVSEVMTAIGTDAHHIIDIVVRNLYERTADIGFLSTDKPLVNYVAGLSDGVGVTQRLRAYRSKYTVYDDILLLDHQGTVLAQIDEHSPVEGSRDPLLATTAASKGYVETFRYSDLRPHQPLALLYSQAMHHPHTHEVCGTLCLSFDFQGEMAGIFAGSRAAQGRCIAMLLDSQDCVLASSDTHWIAPGTCVPTNHSGAPTLFTLSGRTYLVRTATAQPYQGYPGPAGWKAQVMVPVEQAFSGRVQRCVDQLPAAIAQGLLSHAKQFCPPLYDVIQAASGIQRVVWNGQVMTAGDSNSSPRLQAVLEQIGETGARTNAVFTQSIRDLYDTVLSAGLHDGESLTQLLADLLDRNLYERANDCRWWALSPVLQHLLAVHTESGEAPAAQLLQATQMLEHINRLYTVYARLMVYDRHGRILCASHCMLEDGQSALSQQIAPATLQAVLALSDGQHYYVSPWTADQAGTDAPTYVYHAPIHAPQQPNSVLGGIAIVFNAIPELQAMLQSALAGTTDRHALYVNRQGLILASTAACCPTGSVLQLPCPELLHVHAGHSQSAICVFQDQYCIMASSVTRGYREFKTTDGYRDEVLAISYQFLGALNHDSQTLACPRPCITACDDHAEDGIDMASFYIGPQLFALRAAHVLEALPASAINPISAGRLPHCLGTLARQTQGKVTGYVWVFDVGAMLTGQPTPIDSHSQVVLLEYGGRKLGVLVSALHGVHPFSPSHLISAPCIAGSSGSLVQELIRANHGQLLVQCIDPQGLIDSIQRPTMTNEAIPI